MPGPLPPRQSEVTVTNSGDVPMLGWMVDWTLPGGHSVASLWNGNATYSGQDVMVHNADWSGSLSPGQSTTFGYVVQGDGGDSATGLPCRVGRRKRSALGGPGVGAHRVREPGRRGGWVGLPGGSCS